MGHPTDEEKITGEGAWKFVLPQCCHLPGEIVFGIQKGLADQLKSTLSLSTIEAGYRETDSDAVRQLRAISCRGCIVTTCPVNTNQPSRIGHDTLASLKDGVLSIRRRNFESYQLLVIPQELRDRLEEYGIVLSCWHQHSRRYPSMMVTLKRRDCTHKIFGCYGNRVAVDRDGEASFFDFSETIFRGEIAKSIRYFLQEE